MWLPTANPAPSLEVATLGFHASSATLLSPVLDVQLNSVDSLCTKLFRLLHAYHRLDSLQSRYAPSRSHTTARIVAALK